MTKEMEVGWIVPSLLGDVADLLMKIRVTLCEDFAYVKEAQAGPGARDSR